MPPEIRGFNCEFDPSLMKAFGVTNKELAQAFTSYLNLINKDGCTKDDAFVVVQGQSRPAVIAYMAVVGLEAISASIQTQLQQAMKDSGPRLDPSRN